ncbi:hypothetical protein [Burkholderia pseudomallei]|uniref:hypothetical protein n=1 Tax=Burkholderia pseudomallei TaxID=28450 RepID=UPI000F1C6047|nr:hypothetical protein [Burkholderia pseudomallei]CAJ3079247.1 Uncharacterised protein [Burkholderia pseudomallei]VCK72291.1 Uncharacterised protein [Burkholderia pseudomallei]VCK79745.1 Uncharacterised protein [Burkholderia pseudomallei]VCK80263.1 Uncharacterised protein [Burkholderia pseudomallei]VCK83584.1 Uncharacterised protein [Burkholderia pseudomallei]
MSSTIESNQAPPVREGRYPYPDENVFLVAGVKHSGPGGVDFGIDGMVIVARAPEFAIDYFKALSPSPEAWSLVNCLTLAQAKWMAQKIAAEKDRAAVLREGLFAFGKKRPWAIFYALTDADSGTRSAEVILAAAAGAVRAHAESNGAPVLGVIAENILLDAIQTMERTRTGKNQKEHYAMDIRGGEFAATLDENIASWSDERREKYRRLAQEFDEYQATGALVKNLVSTRLPESDS